MTAAAEPLPGQPEFFVGAIVLAAAWQLTGPMVPGGGRCDVAGCPSVATFDLGDARLCSVHLWGE